MKFLGAYAFAVLLAAFIRLDFVKSELDCDYVSCVGSPFVNSNFTDISKKMDGFGFTGLNTTKITDFLNSTGSQLFQFYQCSFCKENGLKMFGVCNANNSDPADCVAVGFYGGEECASTEMCSLGGWAEFSFTTDCSSINPEYPDCKLNCALPYDADGIDTCGAVPEPTPTPSTAPFLEEKPTLNTTSSTNLHDGDATFYGPLIFLSVSFMCL